MQTPVFKENIEGRVRNLALSASNKENCLVPLFEAISNAMQSIKERYPNTLTSDGKIEIFVERDLKTGEISLSVTDNGVGLNNKNFDSFLEIDSDHKLKIGGKGIGRLTWLKVFESAKIKSRYYEAKKPRERSFEFVLSKLEPLKGYKDTEVTSEVISTEVS